MEPLSSFAINIAAAIVFNKISPPNKGVDKGIKDAFEKATIDWSNNKLIREKKINELKLERDKYLESLITSNATIPTTKEVTEFIKHFTKRICENHSAYNYLKEIKDEKRHQKQITDLTEIKSILYQAIVKYDYLYKQHLDNSNENPLVKYLKLKKDIENTISKKEKEITTLQSQIFDWNKELVSVELKIEKLKNNTNG